MRTTAAATVVAVLASAVCAQTTGEGPAAPVAAAEDNAALLAAESFYHSAVEMTCSPSDTPGRAGRLVVLCRFADRLAPGDWRIHRLLADIYLAQGRPELEAAALEKYLAAFPADHARRLRWMAARLQQIQTADGRAAFLDGLIARQDLPPAARAEAGAMLARLRQAQGRLADANSAVSAALKLDPYSPGALALWASLGPRSAAEQVEILFRMLRGDPGLADTAWRLGLELANLGLYRDALRFLDQARAGHGDLQKPEQLPLPLLVPYANVLLDAGDTPPALEILEPAAARFTRNADVNSLLIEAHRLAGRAEKAEKLIEQLGVSYRNRQTEGEVAGDFAAELAWFYTLTQPRPTLAIAYAERAAQGDANHPVFQRILGAAELASNRPDGEARLRKLLSKDTYASVLLVRRYAATGKADQAREAILAAAGLSRSGPAWRQLAALAAEQKIALPPPASQQRAAELARGFDQNYLDLLRKPQDYISVEVQAARPAPGVGEPIAVVATVRNDGAVDIPVGERGLLAPRLAVAVAAAEDGKRIGVYGNLPMAVWPAPRYLPPGQSLRAEIRLDVCDLALELARRPLSRLAIEADGLLDPSPKGGSSLPTVPVRTAQMARTDVLGDFDRADPAAWVKAYQYALGRIVGDLRRGSIAQRMLAARRTASLLAFARQVELRIAEVPPPLAGAVDKLVLLSMTRAFLQDRAAAVRQEMIAALRHVALDEMTISLLSPALEDSDPMVRCRVLELLGGARTRGARQLLDLFARDQDELVRAMAEAFRGK